MHIRTYIRRLEKFLQQRFNKKLNISLFVSRRSKYAHLDLDILLLSTRVYSEFIATLKKNRDPKCLFTFHRLIHATKGKCDYIHYLLLEKKHI